MADPVARTPALRVCVPFEDLPADLCACPDRCRIEQCTGCLREVHYDPKASIPALGPETIMCTICMPLEQFISPSDGTWVEYPAVPGGPFTGAQDPAFRLPPETSN